MKKIRYFSNLFADPNAKEAKMAHTQRALDTDITHIQQLLITMGQKAQHMLENSMKALVERNTRLAEEVIQFDKEVDEIELQIDQAIYEVIALRQPAAGDLRKILAAIKINNDMERVGDYCESICRQVIKLNQCEVLKEASSLEKIAVIVKTMLGECILAFTKNDVTLAKKVILADDDVDDGAHEIFDRLQALMKESSEWIEPASALLLVASKLERIADQATNISEEVIFSVTGDNVRHRSYFFAIKGDK